MDDLISRSAAIDFIDAGKYVNPNEPRWSDNEIVAFLQSRPSAQQWHTGEPTEDGDYLVYKYGDDDGFGYFYVDTFYIHEGTVEYGTPLAYRGWQDDHDRVVAWMPLPEAPEVKHE